MTIRDGLERVARAAAARPLPVLLAVALLALGGRRCSRSGSSRAPAPTRSPAARPTPFRATDDLHRRFGDDAVVVLIDERVADLVLTADLGRTIRLEGCLGGNVPRGARPYGGARSPCAALARLKPVKLVYGPGTFLNESVRAVQNAVTAQLRAIQQQVAAAPPTSARRRRPRRPTRSSACGSPPASRDPADRQQAVHLADRLRPGARRGRAEGALRRAVPEPRRGADPGAPAPRPHRRRALAGDRR